MTTAKREYTVEREAVRDWRVYEVMPTGRAWDAISTHTSRQGADAAVRRLHERDEREVVLDRLREWCPPGTTVYTVMRHVSSSGMFRVIEPVVFGNSDRSNPIYLTRSVADAGIFKYNARHDGLELGGCGMDMGFELVYTLSHNLYPKGFECVGKGDPDVYQSYCPSNDHSNGDRNYEPHWHSSGGYALRHRWL